MITAIGGMMAATTDMPTAVPVDQWRTTFQASRINATQIAMSTTYHRCRRRNRSARDARTALIE